MGLLCPNLVAYFFNPKGDLLGGERRAWGHPAPRKGAGPYQIYDKPFQGALAAQFREWQQALGINPTTANQLLRRAERLGFLRGEKYDERERATRKAKRWTFHLTQDT